ncbi:MAG: addiction module toxin, HicA family [Deltaproteobacteria bacterium]|nr:addiction module toxin, HicA family [Deltaproteobacteria bacterium]
MGKLRVFSGKEVCKILEKHGFVEVRRRGSHIAMQRKTSLSTVTVLSIIRQSGLSRSEFE